MGTDRGAGLATSVPPVHLAKQASDEAKRPSGAVHWPRFDKVAAEEVTLRVWQSVTLPSADEEGSTLDIDAVFKRRIASLRYLARRDRPAALRAAQEERAAGLRAHRERRAAARYRRMLLLRRLTPKPQR